MIAKILPTLSAFFLFSVSSLISQEAAQPVGQAADLSKPVKVFVLMGQSNMLGFGKVAGDKEGTLEYAVKKENLYPFLIDETGKWNERLDVRNVFAMGSGGPSGKGGVKKNEFLAIKKGKIGPEIGIGHRLGDLFDEPVLILKSCIGNRSLGWDLLPPGSPSYEYDVVVGKSKTKKTFVFAGYGQSPDRWEKGTEAKAIGWKAGVQYDGDVARAKRVLNNLDKYYPGANGLEVTGFFWWQGDKDRYQEGHAAMYGKNLVNLVKALRKDFDAPNAKFVCATLGQTDKESATGNEKLIIDGMFQLEKNRELKGSVATVYTHPSSMGGASNSHYNGNAKTYMNVGLKMGDAMVELLK